MLNHPAKTRDDFSISPHFRTHLQCHIDSKHPKSFQSKADKFVLVNKTHKGKNTRQFQCTYCKCGAKITRLGQHLHCTHKITDAKVLSQVKASCIHLPNLNKPRTTTEGSLIARPQPKKTKKTTKKVHHLSPLPARTRPLSPMAVQPTNTIHAPESTTKCKSGTSSACPN